MNIMQRHFQEILERRGFFNSLTFNSPTLIGLCENREAKQEFVEWLYKLHKRGIEVKEPEVLFANWQIRLPRNVHMDYSSDYGYDEFCLTDLDGQDEYVIGVDKKNDCQNYFIGKLGDEPQVDFFRIEDEDQIFLTERYKIKSIRNKIHSFLTAEFYNSIVVVKLTVPSLCTSIHVVYRDSIGNQQEGIEALIQNIHYNFFDVDELFEKLLDYMEEEGLIRVASIHKRLGLLSEVIAENGQVVRHTYFENNQRKTVNTTF